jgi:hypothetical protein
MRNEIINNPKKLENIKNVIDAVKESFESFYDGISEDALKSSLNC